MMARLAGKACVVALVAVVCAFVAGCSQKADLAARPVAEYDTVYFYETQVPQETLGAGDGLGCAIYQASLRGSQEPAGLIAKGQ